MVIASGSLYYHSDTLYTKSSPSQKGFPKRNHGGHLHCSNLLPCDVRRGKTAAALLHFKCRSFCSAASNKTMQPSKPSDARRPSPNPWDEEPDVSVLRSQCPVYCACCELLTVVSQIFLHQRLCCCQPALVLEQLGKIDIACAENVSQILDSEP